MDDARISQLELECERLRKEVALLRAIRERYLYEAVWIPLVQGGVMLGVAAVAGVGVWLLQEALGG